MCACVYAIVPVLRGKWKRTHTKWSRQAVQLRGQNDIQPHFLGIPKQRAAAAYVYTTPTTTAPGQEHPRVALWSFLAATAVPSFMRVSGVYHQQYQ